MKEASSPPSLALGRRIPGLPLVPTLAAAALPKCPLCLAAALSVVGAGSLARVVWLRALTLALLAVAVALLAWGARRRRGYGPFLLGSFASALILLSKLRLDSRPAMYAGAALMVLASLWNTWPKSEGSAGGGCGCEVPRRGRRAAAGELKAPTRKERYAE